MGILLAFAPFIIFAIVDRFAGSEVALVAGGSVSAILLLRDLITPNRSPKILEIGTFLLFCGLVGAVKFTGWYPEHIRSQPQP
jgi:predicted PurR-regulated permease PerM